ncbi:phosphoglycolate phosphatase [Phytohalomonas tamaricis]|uniref:phosphoglycolate phosphatase n=1 Tax=Phytohalomonas tamaricis TaxID=2081032 RepID=UPI000D0B4416|nr:phosphoglycolate phosphatase [Phytohalomonas tamaricis]
MHPALYDIRLIAYDLDGTLVDSAPDLAAAVDLALEERNMPPAGIERVRTWVGNGSRKLIERALVDAVARGLCLPFDQAALDAVHDRFLHYYAQAPCERTVCYPGVEECLSAQHARGITQILITNKPKLFIAPILEALELDDVFAMTLGGDSLNEKKPHPAPLLFAAERFDIPAAQCLMIGDSKNDVLAGQAAGFRTLAVPYGYNHGEPVADSRPDWMVETLKELV